MTKLVFHNVYWTQEIVCIRDPLGKNLIVSLKFCLVGPFAPQNLIQTIKLWKILLKVIRMNNMFDHKAIEIFLLLVFQIKRILIISKAFHDYIKSISTSINKLKFKRLEKLLRLFINLNIVWTFFILLFHQLHLYVPADNLPVKFVKSFFIVEDLFDYRHFQVEHLVISPL